MGDLRSRFTVELPSELERYVSDAAKARGVSRNRMVVEVLAVWAVEDARDPAAVENALQSLSPSDRKHYEMRLAEARRTRVADLAVGPRARTSRALGVDPRHVVPRAPVA